MHYYPKPMLDLIDCIAKLPGIGVKTGERLALHILKSPKAEAEKLARSIAIVKEHIRFCSKCFGLSDKPVCDICENPARLPHVLCVVEQPADMVAIEKSGAFRGRYHILQGVLSPMDGVGPDKIRIRELLDRLHEEKTEEVILATGTSLEGETTASFLSDRLKESGVRITRIASGVPIGGDLKYIDQVTLKRAMEGRYAL
ncbi:MAG: recombination mediator RecR [Proteobacteria bacterium]|nr:recombination mediator RecR [Pseudomonadota bacterium]MCG2753315.1 recombination mediator RecR [Desulfobacteraceae bacterium]